MEPMLQAYLINTAASSFDILTTAIQFKVNGNPNERDTDMGIHGNDALQDAMEKKGAFKGALKGEAMRRLGFFAVAGLGLLGESTYTLITGHQAFPVGEFILLGFSIPYAFAGATNLIKIAYGKHKNVF